MTRKAVRLRIAAAALPALLGMFMAAAPAWAATAGTAPIGSHSLAAHSGTQTVTEVSSSALPAAIGHGRIKPLSINQQAVSPRLSLPGCGAQDGFNGQVQWGSLPNTPFVKIWGEIWDLCGTSPQVWVSFDDPTSENGEAGSAQPYTTYGVNASAAANLNPGNIKVTVCAEWQGKWRCGTPSPV
jgi:hypothetical protein